MCALRGKVCVCVCVFWGEVCVLRGEAVCVLGGMCVCVFWGEIVCSDRTVCVLRGEVCVLRGRCVF